MAQSGICGIWNVSCHRTRNATRWSHFSTFGKHCAVWHGRGIGVKHNAQGYIKGTRAIVRYVDDFICFCESKEDAEHVQRILVEWLLGGQDIYSNLALVHLFCHQHIHAVTERNMRDCQQYNDQELLAEEKRKHQQSKQEENKEPCNS